jgi:hypothetical protein
MELNKKIKIGNLCFSIVMITIINFIPIKNFFGHYYLNLYVLLPLFIFQLFNTIASKKYNKTSIIIGLIINLIIGFMLYGVVKDYY